MEIKIVNKGFLTAFMLLAGDSSGALSVINNNRNLHTLLRKSWIFFTWEGHCTERGKFVIGPVYIEGSDPLGLFPFKLIARETTLLYVYPINRSISVKAPGGIPLGSIISSNPLFEDTTHIRSLRPYQKGDEPRRINWKISAHTLRTGSLMVNEYEATASYPLMIFLNANRNEYPLKKQTLFIERTIEAAAALCLKASLERQKLGIVIYSSGLEGGISVIAPAAFTLVPILESLAVLDWKKKLYTEIPLQEDENIRNSVKAMLDQGKYLSYGTRFFYTGPDLGDEAYIRLESLKRFHLSLEYLIIDDRYMPALVPGNSRRYQMKEKGHEII
ncbi:MAG: DUF58 domain-containing protein [Treponema sp.]|nr:DUF58 domain-containing protein [Treponema sp.]